MESIRDIVTVSTHEGVTRRFRRGKQQLGFRQLRQQLGDIPLTPPAVGRRRRRQQQQQRRISSWSTWNTSVTWPEPLVNIAHSVCTNTSSQ